MQNDVQVREVGPRDGLQLVKQFMPTETKIAWIKAEAEAGVVDFEVTSFVPPSVIPQFADARDVATESLKIDGINAMVLVPNLKGAEMAFETGSPQVNGIVSVSKTHNEANVRRTRDESVEGFRKIVELRNNTPEYANLKVGCGLPTALGCTLEGNVAESEVLKVAEQLLNAGADEIMIPDTVGYASPSQVRSLLKQVIPLCGDIPVVAHFHDTRGLGLANVYAALEAGCTRFDASLAGFGGCPFAPGATGNIVTEDLVFLLEAEGLKTGIDVMALRKAREILTGALPEEAAHGAILKAGLPKGFVPATAQVAAE